MKLKTIVATIYIALSASEIYAHGNPHDCRYEAAETMAGLKTDYPGHKIVQIMSNRVIVKDNEFYVCDEGYKRNASKSDCIKDKFYKIERGTSKKASVRYLSLKQARGCGSFLAVVKPATQQSK